MSYSLPNKKEHLFDEVNEYIYPNIMSNKKHISDVIKIYWPQKEKTLIAVSKEVEEI